MLDDDTPPSKAVAGGVQTQKRKAMQTSYPPETTRLRMACDRCHAHKLRCLRSESTEPGSKCERCRRAAVQCIYSPPNRLGRPARSHSGTGIAAKPTTSTIASTPSKESQSNSHIANAWPSPKSPHPPSPMPYQDISTRGSSMDILADESGAFEDLHLSGSHFKLDVMLPLISSAKQPYEDANIMLNNGQGFPMENIPNAHITQEFTLADENTADCVRKLTDLGLAQYNQLRQLKRIRSCTNRDKQGLLTLLHNYPIQEIMETARQLTELVDQFIRYRGLGATCSALPRTQLANRRYVGMELEISIVVQVSEHILNRLCNSLGLPQGQDTGQSRLRSEMITPAMLQAVQVQERLDAQDEKGDTFTQLPLVINSVKKMIKVRPFL
ncbi:uncharacterized protein TERG_08601 [Trichophyton rubrum CBS 118892]|uniref:Zn(2)-C6 fungal-type domain-containing protein n=1 Tax=Trichophyton rubrum (strain ATCC MYA-4607 / CBS 118892) TaxID=559305 RepID=F2T1B3_TRIRC|nr:uncharacterized protein TERG_08601 [Trichophyton rubrum CBS 118892]EGD92385.1 hypothetical protein TERG_08601 [Trichophyton rubrum CBS 118892]